MKTKLIFILSLYLTLQVEAQTMIFSKKLITATTAEGFPAETFQVGDKIYCKIFLNKPVEDQAVYNGAGNKMGKAECFNVNPFIDPPDNVIRMTNYEKVIPGQTTYTFIINESSEKITDERLQKYVTVNQNAYTNALNGLSIGIHKIKFNVFGCKPGGNETKKPIAEGEITIEKNSGAMLKIGKSFNDIKPKMQIPNGLEPKWVSYINDFYQKGNKNSGACMKAKILCNDWIIVHDKYTGAILYRYLDLALLWKDEKGVCFISFQRWGQQFNGAGYQDALHRTADDVPTSVYLPYAPGACDCE